MSTPTLPTDHEEYEALGVAWALNALEPADLEVFEAHRDGCERCTRTAYEALEVAGELAYGVPDLAPPPRLRERVIAAATQQRPIARPGRSQEHAPAARPSPRGGTDRLEADPRGRRADRRAAGGDDGRFGGPSARRRPSRHEAARRPEETGPGRLARGLRGSRRLVYALAAAVLVAGSAITTWEVTRPAAVTDRIAAIIAGDGTVATVVAHLNSADVVTDVLPPNTGRGTAYYLWGVPAEDGGTPQVLGTFQVTATGLHSYPLRLTRSLDGFSVLAISEERAGSTPSAPSRVLGKGSLGG